MRVLQFTQFLVCGAFCFVSNSVVFRIWYTVGSPPMVKALPQSEIMQTPCFFFLVHGVSVQNNQTSWAHERRSPLFWGSHKCKPRTGNCFFVGLVGVNDLQWFWSADFKSVGELIKPSGSIPPFTRFVAVSFAKFLCFSRACFFLVFLFSFGVAVLFRDRFCFVSD